jgi:hypothetical protein
MAANRAYYLLDTSAALHHYIPDKKITPQLDHIIEQHGLGKAFIFIPQFCVSELFNAFSRLYYRKKETYPQEYQEAYLKDFKSLPQNDYDRVCHNFKEDIKFGRLFYNYELSRYHIFNADHVITYEHQVDLVRFNPKTKKEEPWFMSTFDILIIAMGIELARIHGENKTYILTCDKRIKKIAENMKQAFEGTGAKKKYNIPEHIIMPKVLYLHEASIKDFPRFKGQSNY